MRGILNAGHGRSGVVIRTVGEDFEPRAFKVFGTVAYAWLVKRGMHVAQTLEDRSITIELRRRLPNEEITPPQYANQSPSCSRSSHRAMVHGPPIIFG